MIGVCVKPICVEPKPQLLKGLGVIVEFEFVEFLHDVCAVVGSICLSLLLALVHGFMTLDCNIIDSH